MKICRLAPHVHASTAANQPPLRGPPDLDALHEWLYSVRLQAMATDSADIWDDFDNPFSRQQRANNEELASG